MESLSSYIVSILHPLFLLCIFHTRLVSSRESYSSMQPLCHVEERTALLLFKQGFEISDTSSYRPSAYPKTLSWNLQGNRSNDCCSWEGVHCDQQTGHVDRLDLSSSLLYGSIHSESSLFSLFHLRSLNLSDNHFNYSLIPSKIASLSRLSRLDLSSSVFFGQVPATVSNMTTLTALDLSSNHFSGQVPPLASMSQLSYLSLAYNNFTEKISASFANLTSLTYLDLCNNRFSGIVPSWLMNLTYLTHLDLSFNPLMQGSVPTSLSQLENLEYLSLSHANLSGTVEADIFLSLKKLTYLQLSHNTLSLVENNKTNITLPQIKYLALSECNTRKFPNFLRFQDELESLFLDWNQIEGLIPEWIWNKSRESMDSIWLGGNQLTGFDHNPVVLPWAHLRLLSFDNNMMQGSLPVPPVSTLIYLASGNRMTGEIPSLICNGKSLIVLNLRDNSLVGKIPSCLGNFSNDLMILNLKGNNFRGVIPEMSSRLKKVDLSQNQFQGKVPKSLANCTLLQVLDLGENQINDSFPLWLGTLPELQVLILRSNLFHGTIENHTTNSEFPKLRIIDLYNNSFAGDLPLEHFKNCDAMKFKVDKLEYMNTILLPSIGGWTLSENYGLTITNKGVNLWYGKVSNLITFIDLSSNKFTGKIPDSLESFKNLYSLNLSNNVLNGSIPPFTGNLTALESFDISKNNLTGKIPPQLAGLGFLAKFDVSFNHLTGPIPQGKQFDLFQNDSYKGNMALCGPPLSKKCGEQPPPSPPLSSEEDDDSGSFLNVVDVIIVSLGFASGLIVGIIYGDKLATKCYKYITICYKSS